jgi:hypothetical protein
VLPADGAVRAVNTTIGASSRSCVASHENSSFVFHEGNVYEVVNYTFTKINTKVPFKLDTTTPPGTSRVESIFLSVVGDRLVVRYFNTVYVFATRTRSWSRWVSGSLTLQNFGPFEEMPTLTVTGAPTRYYAGSSLTQHEGIYYVQDGYDSVAAEANMNCFILSKSYDFNQSSQFKKLAWWGADVFGSGAVTAVATPVFVGGGFTWQQLHAYTWDSLLSWQLPIVVNVSTETDVGTGGYPQKMFLKFLKAMRFRQVNFQLNMVADGSTITGPARIYSLTVVVGVKELTPAQVS